MVVLHVCIYSELNSIDWEDETWCLDFETESVSSLEEYDTKEVDSDSEDRDDEYIPRICVR